MAGTKPSLLLGAHVSIAGGVEKAVARGERIGCTAIQIFTRNASRWQSRPLEPVSVRRFREALAASRIAYVAAHDSYLINLASPDERLREKSLNALRDELQRCRQLGIGDLVMHPGAHVGSGADAGLKRIAEGLNRLRAETDDAVRILLENTAGQGSVLGASFAELAEILERVPGRRFAVCLDTCHAFAAGYDLGTRSGYDRVMDEFDRHIGLERLALIHANDSKKGLGSRIDRHEHVGRGEIGTTGFAALMEDRRLDGIPRIIETPGGEDHCEDLRNLALLRRLAGKR